MKAEDFADVLEVCIARALAPLAARIINLEKRAMTDLPTVPFDIDKHDSSSLVKLRRYLQAEGFSESQIQEVIDWVRTYEPPPPPPPAATAAHTSAAVH